MTLPARRLRILHLPVDLGGHAAALARAQRAMGHDAIAINLAWSPYGFHGDINHGWPNGHPWRLVRREAGRFSALMRSVFWADVIHCHFGQSLLSLRAFPIRASGRTGIVESLTVAVARMLWLQDVRLWKSLGKKVAMTFYGDDLRMIEAALMRNPWTHLALPEIAEPLADRDGCKKQMVAELVKHGVALFATNPDLLVSLPADAQFLAYGHVDVLGAHVRRPAPDGTLRFLHLPTQRAVKGTPYFVEAVARLEASGQKCTLTIAENVTNASVPELLAQHDVLLDHWRVGWYGGVAIEAMATGMPVVAHLLPEDIVRIPAGMAAEIPIITANPSTVTGKLQDLINMPAGGMDRLSMKSRKFVERWHNPQIIAKQVIDRYLL